MYLFHGKPFLYGSRQEFAGCEIYTRAVSIIIHLGCKIAVCSVRKQEADSDANSAAYAGIIVPSMLRKP